MKVLVFVSGVLAVVSGQWAGHAPVGYQNQIPQHVPVIKDGVPVETPEVQHAKAAHFAAITEARSHPSYQPFDESQQYIQQEQYNQQGQYNQQPQGGRYTAPVQGGYSGFSQGFSGFNQGGYSAQPVQTYNFQPAQYSAPAQHAAPVHGQRSVIPAFETTHAVPQVGHDGKPLDTPEVEAAKAQHFALVNEALVRNAPKPGYQNQPAPHYRQRRGIYAAYPQHIPVIGHNGVPVEPIEVQKARAEHLAAYSGVSHNTGHLGYSVQQHHAPVYGHHDSYTHFVPSYGHDGRPLDTPEVEHAKAAHFAAYHEAASRNSLLAHGVPADTPAVQHAKALHYAAHAAASSHAHHY